MKWTVRDLLDFFEEYYGEKYAGTTLGVMTDYLDGHSDAFYRAAAKVMTKRFSRSYGKSPCPADIERHMDEIEAAMPKPEYLPEPETGMTREERAEIVGNLLAEARRILGTQKTAPMAKPLAGAASVWGKA